MKKKIRKPLDSTSSYLITLVISRKAARAVRSPGIHREHGPKTKVYPSRKGIHPQPGRKKPWPRTNKMQEKRLLSTGLEKPVL